MFGIVSKIKAYGLAVLGVITTGLWLAARAYRASRDKAREKVQQKERELAQAKARAEQRMKAAEADREGAAATSEKRQEAKKRADQGKRDHFEESW